MTPIPVCGLPQIARRKEREGSRPLAMGLFGPPASGIEGTRNNYHPEQCRRVRQMVVIFVPSVSKPTLAAISGYLNGLGVEFVSMKIWKRCWPV